MRHIKKFYESDDFSRFVDDVDFSRIGFDYWDTIDFSTLLGRVIQNIIINREKTQILFVVEGEESSIYEFYIMHHNQDCCEHVYIYDINGDLEDIIGEPLLKAEEVINIDKSGNYDSATWTYYNLGTINGHVNMRWLGESNGYYSETVDLTKSNTIAHSYDEMMKLVYNI